MTEIEIPLPGDVDCELLSETIEEICIASNLRVTLKASLSKCPGSTHWHFKRGNENGTLEITLWPSQHRAWFSIHDGRARAWIREKVASLQGSFQNQFASR